MPQRTKPSRERKIAILELFNEKAERLEQLSYTQYLRNQGAGFKASAKIGEEASFSVRGPTLEQTEAFALTLGYFFKNNEPISFERLRVLYPQLGVEQELVDQYLDGYQKLNAFLDRASNATLGAKTLANRDILEVFLWGGLAHSTRKAEYDAWAAQPFLFGFLTLLFTGVMTVLLNFIYWLKHHNERAIGALHGAASGGG